MKKIFMFAIAALALAGCGKNDLSGTAVVPTEHDSQVAAYTSAFIQKFGIIDKNQTWGFGDVTRSHNVNGNLWYQNWERPVNEVIPEEEQLVLAEFSKKRENQVNEISLPWNNYWVHQIHQSNNRYKDANKQDTGDIHEKMNKIIAYNAEEFTYVVNGVQYKSHYEHVNNFNNGTNTTEYTDDVTGQKYKGTTLMVNMGETETNVQFGYHNTLDSKDHFEYYVIAGEDIDPRLAGYYYVGFDFKANDDKVQTTFRYVGNDMNETITVDGYYKTVADAAGVKVKVNKTEWVLNNPGTNDWTGHNETREVELTVGQDGTWSIESYQHGNMWVERDWIYNDWIVRISPAIPAGGNVDRVKEQGIIIAEDLGSIGDFDFNDVVFEAYVWESGKTEITLLAAGGTLDLEVAGVEVHGPQGFNVEKQGNSNRWQMVNTGHASGVVNNIPYVTFTAADTYNSLKDIPIVVKRTNEAGEVTSYTLTAEMGRAPQKICVPLGFSWCKERMSLADVYPGFKAWTTGAASTWANGECQTENVISK